MKSRIAAKARGRIDKYRVPAPLEALEASQMRGQGRGEIHLTLEANIMPNAGMEDWDHYLRMAWNPKIPSLEEAMQQTLTADETEKFTKHLRPLVVGKQGIGRGALAYLWAVKH